MDERHNTTCARCGSCTAVCPVYRVDGLETLTARGRMHLLGLGLHREPTSRLEDVFAACLLCGACESVCPRNLPIRDRVVETRQGFAAIYGHHGLEKYLARKILARPEIVELLSRLGVTLKQALRLPPHSGLRRRLGLLDAPQASDRVDDRATIPAIGPTLAYFPGCLARHLQPSIAQATGHLVQRFTGRHLLAPGLAACCGLAAHASGELELARRLARRNIEAFADSTGPILTSCASCWAHLRAYPTLFEGEPVWQERALAFGRRVTEFAAFMGQVAVEPLFWSNVATIFYHDPCHLRFSGQGGDEARRLIGRIAKLRLLSPINGPACCGQGGLFRLGYPTLSARIFARALDTLPEEPDLVTTTCSGCLLQWQEHLHNRAAIRVVHLAQVLRESLLEDGWAGAETGSPGF